MRVNCVWMTGAGPLLDKNAPESLKASLRSFYRRCFTGIEQYVHFKDFARWERFGGDRTFDECLADSHVTIWGGEDRVSALDRIRLTEDLGLEVEVNLDVMSVEGGPSGYHRYVDDPWLWPLDAAQMDRYAEVCEQLAIRGYALGIGNELYYRKPGTGWPVLDYDSLYGDLLRARGRPAGAPPYIVAESGPWLSDAALRARIWPGWHEVFHDAETPAELDDLLAVSRAAAQRGYPVRVAFDEIAPTANNANGTRGEWGASMYRQAVLTAHDLGCPLISLLADYEVGSAWGGFMFLVLKDGTWTPAAHALAETLEELGITEPGGGVEPLPPVEDEPMDARGFGRALRAVPTVTGEPICKHPDNWTEEETIAVQQRLDQAEGGGSPGPSPTPEPPSAGDAALANAVRQLLGMNAKAVRVESGNRLFAEWRGESGSPKEFPKTEDGFIAAVDHIFNL